MLNIDISRRSWLVTTLWRRPRTKGHFPWMTCQLRYLHKRFPVVKVSPRIYAPLASTKYYRASRLKIGWVRDYYVSFSLSRQKTARGRIFENAEGATRVRVYAIITTLVLQITDTAYRIRLPHSSRELSLPCSLHTRNEDIRAQPGLAVPPRIDLYYKMPFIIRCPLNSAHTWEQPRA